AGNLKSYNKSSGYTDSFIITGSVGSINVIVDKTSPQNPGTPVTLTATSSGSSNPIYKFWVRENGVWKVLQDYSTDNKFVWSPPSNGEYLFSVHAKDTDSKAGYESYKTLNYTITSEVENVDVTVDKTSPQNPGTPVTLTATSSGSSNPIYKFWVRENGVWKVLQDYSTDNKFVWSPPSNGEYLFSVHAKDKDSKAGYESYKTLNYTITSEVENVDVTVDKTSPQNPGTPVTLTATSSGSANPIYKFWIRENGVWKVLQDYSTDNKFVWTPPSTGKYLFSVHAKDTDSKAGYESYKTLNYIIEE
ncbi:hypothetical protein ON064_18335, partial [Planococcus sp. A6]|uniref:triple tyrosine motif-containing protein n=1 Tax=Planococcus sp. A6 TaxID=2992760 RepID=UPI00237C04C6